MAQQGLFLDEFEAAGIEVVWINRSWSDPAGMRLPHA